MRAVLLGLDEAFLAAREAKGQHKLDERWEGEWHLVNPLASWHTFFNSQLFRVLAALADRGGLVGFVRIHRPVRRRERLADP